MKLYLSSVSIPAPQEYLALFAGKDNPKIAIISNAWGAYPAEKAKPFIDAVKTKFKNMGMIADPLDLLDYRGKQEELRAKLLDYDGIWVTGGNSYYLNWAIRQSGLHDIIRDLCQQGLVYGGESAGAIVAGPTLEHFQELDDFSKAPEIILRGMRLIDTVIIPHAGNPKYGEKLRRARLQLERDGYKTRALADEQAMVIDEVTQQ